MKKWTTFLIFHCIVCCQSCKIPSQESHVQSSDLENSIIDPVEIWCYEINGGQPFNNPLVINKEFSGRIAIRAELDTNKQRLINIKIIKTYLRLKKDSTVFVDYYNTDFDKEPKYPIELLNLIPQIKQYIDTVKVIKLEQPGDCQVPSSYSFLLKIK